MSNYSPKKRHISGLVVNPYTIVLGPSGGITYANGKKYIGGGGSGSSPQPANVAPATPTPHCGSCQ